MSDSGICFEELLTNDEYARSQTLDAVIDTLRSLIVDAEAGDVSAHRVLHGNLATITRFAYQCPFPSIRDPFQVIHTDLTRIGLVCDLPKVSHCFRDGEVPSLFNTVGLDHELQPWLEDIFLISGRISHLEQILCLLPQVMPAFVSTVHVIMTQEGSLPASTRYYLSIIAASEYKCHYLTSISCAEFMRCGGDHQWLTDSSLVSPKLKSIRSLNSILAHQPWLVTPTMISELKEGPNRWTEAELVHAILILTSYHAISGLVMGLGVAPEIDIAGMYEYSSTDKDSEESDSATQLQELEDTVSLSRLLANSKPDESIKSTTEIDWKHDIETPEPVVSAVTSECSCCVGVGEELAYEDFITSKAKHGVHTFKLEDFSWKDHGYGLVCRYMPEAAKAFDEEFSTVYNMTDNCVGKFQNNVDTGPFRRAIWHYSHVLYGMKSDCFDYAQVNTLLNRQLKRYIKKVVCYPQHLIPSDFLQQGYVWRADEKVHVALLAVEGRRRACLLYGLHAVMNTK